MFPARSIPCFVAAAVWLLLAGCSTAPSPSPTEKAPQSLVKDLPTPPPVAHPVPEPEPLIEKAGDLPLQTISEPQRGNPDVPFDFVNANARVGLTLRPSGEPSIFPLNSTGGSVGFYHDVALPKLEVQELDDGRIRIWVRVVNRAHQDIKVRVQCIAALSPSKEEKRAYDEVIFERDVYRDFSFILDGPKDRRFTILVKESADI
ncbi:MAG: hypothetical protein E1N59_2652 [Puniceicoccaceae bacterium 5H]|nr:MAG: hypothetical protein E1N59_2652 [Puniceicoccaceae bacterium 5H]